jgi:hypothetical protein
MILNRVVEVIRSVLSIALSGIWIEQLGIAKNEKLLEEYIYDHDRMVDEKHRIYFIYGGIL